MNGYKRVQLPTGKIAEFPESMSDEEITHQLRKQFPPESHVSSENKETTHEQSFIEKLPKNILAGLAQMGHGVINAPHNITKAISPKFAEHIPKQHDYDYPKMLGLPEESSIADKLIRGAVQYAPAMMLPVANMGIGAAAASLPMRMGAQAVPQAAFGATQNPNAVHGALEGAAAGAGGELIGTAVKLAFHALKPSTRLRGNLSEEELKRNLEAAKGTNTGLGRVLESPTLNRTYENILPHILGSGAESQMQKTAGQITNKGEGLLEKVRGKLNPGDFGIEIQQALKKASQEARNEKNLAYEKLNKQADKAGLSVGRENFQSTANNVIQEIKQSPELMAEFTPSLLKDLERYANNPEGNTLKLTNIFRGKLGDKANELYQEGKMHEYGIVNSLKESLSKDIESAFEKNPNKLLKSAYAKNQKDYMEKFAPFEDKDIVKFTRQGGDPDLILPHFLRGGKNDRASILTKLTSKLQDKNTNIPSIVSYAHLSKAVDKEGRIDPMKLAGLYRNLGEKQKKALFPDKEMRNEFEKFSHLVGMNKESFDLMRNPKTGSRNSDLLVKMAQVLGGSMTGSFPGFLASLLGTTLTGKIGTKLLSNEKVRENLIEKMLKANESKKSFESSYPGLLHMELNEYAGEEK